MKFQLKPYILVGFLSLLWLLSCDDEDYEQSTITFYPTLEAASSEPAAGVQAAPIHVVMRTSRVLATESQVNIRIEGAGAGYGYSYVTLPAMLEPGVLTLTMPAGEAETSFDFIPRNDGIFVPTDYHYEFKITETSNAIKSVGQGTFRVTVKDNTTPFQAYYFDECENMPAGFREERAGENVMQANVWGCSDFGYPNDSKYVSEANAYNKGGTFPSNSYFIMTTPINADNYSQLFIGAMAYSRHPGLGELKFRYSTNYTGTGNPEAEGVVWTDFTKINEALPEAGSQEWIPVSELFASPGGTIYIAIQFVGGTTASSASWRIDNIELKGI
jgi:hypothetical protein